MKENHFQFEGESFKFKCLIHSIATVLATFESLDPAKHFMINNNTLYWTNCTALDNGLGTAS